MNIKLRRVGVVLLVAGISLGILFAAFLGWKKYFQEDPVASKLSTIQGVNAIKVDMQRPDNVIEVQLTDIANLKQTAQQLSEVVPNGKLVLLDSRTPELQDLLEKTRFFIEEAIAQGNFTTMEKAVDSAAKDAKLDRYGVYMDAEYIYLQFHKGDKALYQVFPRQPSKARLITKG